MSCFNCRTRHFTLISALVLALGLLLSSAASAKPNPKNIQGYNNLYADLDGDGHVERVGLVYKERNWGRQTMEFYQIVVYNDKGQVIWRSPDQSAGESASIDLTYNSDIRHCLLHDIDGDGNIELVFSGWDSVSMGADYDLYTHAILRWKNGKFTKLDPYLRLNTTKDSDICKFDKSFSDYVSENGKEPDPEETGRSLIHNLRKVNGQVWGDKKFFGPSDVYAPGHLPNILTNTQTHPGSPTTRWIIHYTVRLETCPGGMRIVEYKKFL